jgi:hypothetical protein
MVLTNSTALQVMLNGYSKQDLPTWNMLPVEADIPALLVEMEYGTGCTTHAQAIGDLALIAFYYLLQIGEYTVKGKRNNTKQTIQFKLKDVKLYKKNKGGTLVCLPNNAPPILITTADSATLKLDNQKKWVERHLCTLGSKWGIIQLPCAGSCPMGHSLMRTQSR